MATELELQNAIAGAEGARIALTWARKHTHDFRDGAAASKLLGDTLAANNLPFTEENLELCFQACLREVPGAAAIFFPPPPARKLLDEQAPIPAWFPRMESMEDVNNIPREKFKQLYSGKAGREFRARLDAIGKGVKNEQ